MDSKFEEIKAFTADLITQSFSSKEIKETANKIEDIYKKLNVKIKDVNRHQFFLRQNLCSLSKDKNEAIGEINKMQQTLLSYNKSINTLQKDFKQITDEMVNIRQNDKNIQKILLSKKLAKLI